MRMLFSLVFIWLCCVTFVHAQDSADINSYIEALKSDGWDIKLERNPVTNGVEIEAEKLRENAEIRGIFRIPWDNRDTLKFMYVPDESAQYRLYNFEGYTEHKAPLLGEWEKTETYNAIPQGLLSPPSIVTGFGGSQ